MSNFQSKASKYGRLYEDHVSDVLEQRGFTIVSRRTRHESGIEFDLVIKDWNGNEIGVECKASPDDAKEPGMVRSDNRWKVLGYLWALRVWKERTGQTVRYMLITSHMPDPTSKARQLLDYAELLGDLQIIILPGPQ